MSTRPLRAATDEAPDPDFRNAFRDQATPSLIRAALRYARTRAILVRRAGRRIDSLYARELVQDALEDTWSGTVAWDPSCRTLQDHVISIIRTRSWKDAQWIQRTPHLPMDARDTAVALSAAASHRFESREELRPIMIADLVVEVVTALRHHSQSDPASLAILDAWSAGALDRDAVLAHTGLAEKDYKAARARLAYLVLNLPASLRDRTTSVLRSAS